MKNKIDFSLKVRPAGYLSAFMVTWFFAAAGSMLTMLFLYLAQLFESGTFVFFLIQNSGLFFFLIFLMAGYTGVYMAVTSVNDDLSAIKVIGLTLKKTGYVALATASTAALFIGFILLQTGFSMVSQVPYLGPAVMAILTAPIFFLNFIAIILAVCLVAVIPPVIAETENFKDIFPKIRELLVREWLNIIFYIIISLALLVLGILLLVAITRYAGGITKALQWKINLAYTPSMNNLITGSFFSELIRWIVPVSDSAAAIKRYGPDLISYFRIVKYIVGLSYMLVISMLTSLPLAVYFTISSLFFKKLRTSSDIN